MAKLEYIAAVDIGTSKVGCLIAVREPSGEINVAGVGYCPSKGVKKGIVVGLEEAASAVEACFNEAGINVRSVYTGLTGQFLSIINSHGTVRIESEDKTVTEQDVREVLDRVQIIGIPSDRQLIHVVPRGFTLDGNNCIPNPLKLMGARLEVDAHIITATKSYIHNIENCLKAAGLEVEKNGMLANALASSIAVLSKDERELGVFLADIGAGTTDIAVFKEGSLIHTDVLSIAGSTITNDIALSLKIPLAEAERIKLEKGCAFPDSVAEDDTFDVQSLSHVESPNVPRRFLAEIIEARVLDIFDWMKKSIAQARSKGGHVASVTFTGGTAQMPGLAELGEKYLGLPVRLGVPQQINGLNEVFLTPSFATVTGLLLYGINQCERGGGVPPPNGLWDKIRDFFEKVL